MKTALKWIFNDKTNTSKDVTNKFENLNIKHDESVFVVNHSTKLRRKIKDEKGKFKCVICDSKTHWAKTSPHKSSNNSVVDVAESLFVIDDETVWDEEVKID